MSDNSQTNTNQTAAPAPVAPAAPGANNIVVQPDPATPAVPKKATPANADDTKPAKPADDSSIVSNIVSNISEAHNILIALSSDPSVDEMAAAIGLSLALDRAGKRATAIYSGKTPAALDFLKPEDTFETGVDALQDFVIAINKDKADHLRYKLDGDFVKIFITPYKARVSEDDLEFSYGDFNIDLVLALDVANGVDLDAALREHGRIMHDAMVINITNGNPGKFGEIEWSNKTASSVSEMAARLLMAMSRKLTIEKEDATALLTGIIAATNRFSNTHTTPSALKVSSELLKFGANQQLISKNITDEVENNIFSDDDSSLGGDADNIDGHLLKKDSTSLNINHDEKGIEVSPDIAANVTPEQPILEVPAELAGLVGTHNASAPTVSPSPVSSDAVATPILPTMPNLSEGTPAPILESTSTPGISPMPTPQVPVPTPAPEPPKIPDFAALSSGLDPVAPIISAPATVAASPASELTATAAGLPSPDSTPAMETLTRDNAEKVIAPSSDFGADSLDGGNKYSQMLEAALAEAEPPAPVAPTVPAQAQVMDPAMMAPNGAAPMMGDPNNLGNPNINPMPANFNPAVGAAPVSAPMPEMNGVPEMNYGMPAGSDILPPPPTPSIDANMPPMAGNMAGVPNMQGMPNMAPAGMPMGAMPTAPAVSPVPMGGMPAAMPAMPMQAATPVGAPIESSAYQIPGM